MRNFKYKLKEITPDNTPDGINVGDIKTGSGVKTTVTDIDSETGAVSWDVKYVPNIEKLVDDVNDLTKTAKEVAIKVKEDSKFLDIYEKSKELRNTIRTHVRNQYPEEYKKIMESELTEESTISSNSGFTSGTEGENYATPFAFNKNKKADGTDRDILTKSPYKFKLAPKPKSTKSVSIVDFNGKTSPLNESETNIEEYIADLGVENQALKKHITSRILGFDKVENKLNELIPLLAQAKNKTMDTYRQKPDFAVIYGTDLAVDYLDDLIEMFKD